MKRVALCLVALLLPLTACDLEERIREAAEAASGTSGADADPDPDPDTPGTSQPESPTPPTTTTSTTAPLDPEAPLYEVPVITLAFLPLGDDGRIAREVVGHDLPDSMLELDAVRKKILKQEAEHVELIKRSSRFRGYKNPTARPSIGYSVRERLEYIEKIPILADNPRYLTDKMAYLNRINVCDYVDKQGIKEVWVWMYHNDGVAAPIESDMSMGTLIAALWSHSNYGDISNSYRRNNMPICNNTYTVYEFNYGRGTDTMQHNLGHQLEAIMSYMDRDLFIEDFVGYSDLGNQDIPEHSLGVPVPRRCGNLHFTPGSMDEYVSWNEEEVLSDCATWNPDGPSEPHFVSCRTWFFGDCIPGEMIPWQTWWMQSLPGWENGLTYKGREMRNWWDFIGDFDAAFSEGRSLTK